MENFIRDFRYALRNFRKDRRFTFIAIFALGLGIGATTVMFSVIYNVFFDPFPYKNFNRTVVLRLQNTANEGGWKGRSFFSRDEFLAFRDHNHVFDDFIGIAFEFFFYNDGKGIRKWHGARISANTFEYLGVQPLLGRVLTPEDEKSGAPPVFVMNYKFWQSEFGGDPKIIGKTFVLSDEVCTLIGIMPRRFNAFDASVWLTKEEKSGGLQIMGHLKPGVSVETAAADLDDIAHRFRDAESAQFSPEKFQIVVETLIDSKIGGFKKTLYALLAAVLLLLLIACSNVANLLLAKATTREREMAMRATMGATRGRLIRQLLVESFALAAAASIVGCGLGYFGLKVVVALIPGGTLPEETNIHMNLDLLLVTLGITLATTLLCGLAPALHVAGSDLQPRLSGSSKGAGGSFRHGKLRGD